MNAYMDTRWECLAVLVALRCWYGYWQGRRLSINIKSESMSALALAERLKVGPSAKLIGKELALLYHHTQFEPKVEHIPGVANQLADLLSRLMDPSKQTALPDVLTALTVTSVPARDEKYYKVLSA